MGLATRANLIVAAMDLHLVRLLRAAMQPQGILPTPGGAGPAPSVQPRRQIQPEPRIEPRPRIQPAPRFEARPVIYTRKIELQEIHCGDMATHGPLPEKAPHPLQPPWKVLPWQQPAPPAPKIKVVLHRPDIINKGSLIDFFM